MRYALCLLALMGVLTACQKDGTYYPDCSAVREAGAAPLHRGDPGFRPALDGNGDGVACE